MNEYRSRWERLDLICREKFDISLPKAMRENQVDMWIHVVKLGNPDPLALDLGVGVSVRCPQPSSGSTGYFVFTDRGGDRIERALLGGFARQGDVYDIVGPEEDLGPFVAERDPKRIAVNMSGWLAVADGLSHTCYLRLVEALGEKYAERLVSAEQVITDFRDRRVISEIVEYGQLGEATRRLIERALSNEVITPGVTTREDVGWWVKEQLLARGIEDSFHRFFMPSIIYSESERFKGYPGPSPHIFQRGDLFQLDFGFSYMNLGTDMKRAVWDEALKIRGLHSDEREKTQVSIDCHCVGNTGNSQIEPGPAISGFRPGRGHLTIKPNHLFAFELFANSPIPEWGGYRARFGLEDDAIVTQDGVQFPYPPNSRILLIY